MKTTDEKIFELLQPSVESLGFILYGIEYLPQLSSAVLRVLIDKEGGITVGELQKAARQVGAELDVADMISSKYTLEVSSPGMDRPLFTPEHCLQNIGAKVAVRLKAKMEERRNYSGVLLSFEDNVMHIESEEGRVTLPWAEVDKARLVPEFKK
jgi:ribosome maturation factor RimP